MKLLRNSRLGLGSEKGQVVALLAVTIVGLLGVAALGVDLGYFFVTRNETQNVADASALAGTRVLGHIYQGLPYPDQQGFYCDDDCVAEIEAAALDVATRNRAGGRAMTVRVEDVNIGQWDGDTFTPTLQQPDAVEVVARRDETANGPVDTFFARVLGIDTGAISAIATAALSGLGTTVEGEVELPIGISRWFFDSQANAEWCNEDIQFYPTNDPASCAGWTSWNYGSNDITLRRILQERPDYASPGIIAGETIFNFTGGTLSEPTFDDLLTLFQIKGYDTDPYGNYLLNAQENRVHQAWPFGHAGYTGPYTVEGGDQSVKFTEPFPLEGLDNQGNWVQFEYPDGTPRNYHKWETTLPVYDRGDCSNPNQSIMIVGFAPIELTDVLNAPDKLVRGMVKCEYVDEWPTRGGGGEYGIKGSIPGLVR